MICTQLICAPKVFPTFGAQVIYEKEEADREHSMTCFSIFSTYDFEKRSVEELCTL